LSSANPKSGYKFYVTAAGTIPIPTYATNGDPITADTTGKRYFFSDASGVIRYNATGVADATALPLQ